jgi:uridine phosphorylase
VSHSKVFHLGLDEAALRGARLAIVPGDPARSEPIAKLMDEPTFLGAKREFTSWLGTLGDVSVVVCSTGIGGPSTSIAVEELAQLGVRTFLRAGTTGAIQPHIEVGDLIVTTGAVRLDGASHHFAPAAYPAVADFDCTTALVRAARDAGRRVHIGITASSDTFYPGQERYDTYSGRVDQDWQGSLQRWQDLNVLNYEMEAATLFTMCSALGLRSGMITAALVNRALSAERPAPSALAQIERDLIETVVDAARILSAA